MSFKEFNQRLADGHALSYEESYKSISTLLTGSVKDADIISFLNHLTSKGETVDEILGFIQGLKDHVISLSPQIHAPIIDICGTGGSNKDRFNISTCVAFVLAAGDVYVAKHGNYGSKRPNGSFNFLEELNIPFQLPPKILEMLLKETHCCFLLARQFHPAMRFVANARKQVGHRTVFNMIGPLVNPANITHQMIGLTDESKSELLIEVIKRLSLDHVKLLIGGDGVDELSLTGTNTMITIKGNEVQKETFNAQDSLGITDVNYTAGDSYDNAILFTRILLDKQWDHPVIKHICLNAAAGFLTMGQVSSLEDGFKLSFDLFTSEKVTEKIAHFKRSAAKLEIEEALN